MQQILNMIAGFISAHPYITLSIVIACWFLSNVVAAMPSPDQSSGKGYKFLFTLGHLLMASVPRIFPQLRLPGDPTRTAQTFFGKPPIPQDQPPAPPQP